MTFLGKILVMVNLVVSLMMATVAMGLYSSSIDWTEKAAKGGDPKTGGLAGQRKATLNTDLASAPAVEDGWRDATGAVLNREARRQMLQQWYSTELVHTRSQATDMAPARDLDIQDNGQPKANPMNPALPLRVAAEDRRKLPLQSIAAYDGLLRKALAENDTHVAALEKEFSEDIVLTNKLTPPAGEKKGLRDRLVDERVKRAGILEEIESVQHLGTKAVVESAVVGERIEALDDQIKGLKRRLSRLGGVDGAK